MRISVVVCTHNRAESLRHTLRSLMGLQVPPEVQWEVLVVDNASSDHTRLAVLEVEQSSELPFRYVYEGEPGLSAARNAGVGAARGEVIAFLDDDARVRPEWLAELRHAFQRHPEAACVGGRVVLASEVERPSWWRSEYEGRAGAFDRGDQPRVVASKEEGMVGIGANLAFRRGVFRRHGLFRTDLGRKQGSLLMGEELELLYRVWKAGGLAVYWPDAVVDHFPGDERFRKPYLRRWSLSFGEWAYHKELESWNEKVRIAGVPRWKYREAAENLARWFWKGLRGDRCGTFFAQLEFLAFLGYLKAALREHGRRPTRAQVRGAGDPTLEGSRDQSGSVS